MTRATPQTSALLSDEPVLLVQGRLARALGLAPALFLQQVHYLVATLPPPTRRAGLDL